MKKAEKHTQRMLREIKDLNPSMIYYGDLDDPAIIEITWGSGYKKENVKITLFHAMIVWGYHKNKDYLKIMLSHPKMATARGLGGNTPLHSLAVLRIEEAWKHPDYRKVRNKKGDTPNDIFPISNSVHFILDF